MSAPRSRSLLSRIKSRALGLRIFSLLTEVLSIPLLFVAAAIAGRFAKRTIDVGLGPEPLINNVYHKRALERFGFTGETFVTGTYYITDEFDFNVEKSRSLARLPLVLRSIALFLRSIFRYRVLFIYMNGGPLFPTRVLRRLEPRLYRTARIRILAMPYGSDVQDLRLSKNLAFVDAMLDDYPAHGRRQDRIRENVDRWMLGADWVISGVDWVDYMFQWNQLMLGHFSIDTEQWKPSRAPEAPRSCSGERGPLRILHAPNHRAIKGTKHLLEAVDRLKAEGIERDLVLLEKVPNTEIRRALETADLVADQFVIGWYAMFAIEAMALSKPVLCYLRPDLLDLYRKAGLLAAGEIPLIDTPPEAIESRIRWAYAHRDELDAIGERGRAYVIRHHSLERIGSEFARILTDRFELKETRALG